jgi:hypothetical protein
MFHLVMLLHYTGINFCNPDRYLLGSRWSIQLSFHSSLYLFIMLAKLGYLASSPPASTALALLCTWNK